MSNLMRELVFLILQFLEEENYKESVHTLERESGHFFNLKYFEEKALRGEWDEVEKYLSGFTKLNDNDFSTDLFFEIRKQKYLEALDRHDREKVMEMINKDLKVFTTYNEETYKELVLLITLKNFRENKRLSDYGDIKSEREKLLGVMRELLKANTLLSEKLVKPIIEDSRLRILINQSLNWQHLACITHMINPDAETLFTDHICLPQDEARAPSPTKPLEHMEIVGPAQCRQVLMQGSVSKVARLLYTTSGNGILVLGTNGVQRLWKWSSSEQNSSGKGNASVTPELWLPKSGRLMENDVPENPEESVPCIALSNNDSYVMSACGGKVSLFNMTNFKVMTTYMPPPPASTFLLFHPQDNNTAAIGMEDSTINIYDFSVPKLKAKLNGHKKHITGLAFSVKLHILVSSGADAQLCFWSTNSWEKKKSSAIQLPAGKSPVGDTRVQFHKDQVHLLVSHETQIAIYDSSKMECIQKWEPQDSEWISSPITCASYSCNSHLVYASFVDGNIGVFDAEHLILQCRIAPSAYMHQPPPNSAPIMPLVITAHPQEPCQIAVGLSDGLVKVLEPQEPYWTMGRLRGSRD